MEKRKIIRGRDTKKDERERIREQQGDSPRMFRRQEIMEMDVGEMEKEIKRTEEAIDDNLQRGFERAGMTITGQHHALPLERRRGQWGADYHG